MFLSLTPNHKKHASGMIDVVTSNSKRDSVNIQEDDLRDSPSMKTPEDLNEKESDDESITQSYS